jgi:hypothetical protein
VLDRVRRRPVLLLGAAAAAPLVLAAIALLWRPWVPVLDMAMTELRVRDVGTRHTPLVGLPGRIGDFPDQGSHPGPWSFWLVAPVYRLAASTAWGMEAASVVINSGCVVAIAWLGRRRAGWQGALVLGTIAVVAVRGYGLSVLSHPWNPYFPLLVWLLGLVAAWLVLLGDHWLAVVVVATTTIAAQTHVPYLVSAIAVDALVLGVLLWRWWRTTPTARGPALAMVGVGAALWLPPFVEQAIDEPGNITRLIRHFATDSPEPPIGLGPALELVTQHFDVVAIAVDLVRRDDALVHRAGQAGSLSPVGVVVIVAWLAAVVWAWRRRHQGLLALHAVAGTAVAAGVVSIARIFGKVWFYLTLWMSSAVLLVVLAIVWTAVLALEERRHHVRAVGERVVLVAAAGVTGLSLVAAVGLQVPERSLGDDVRVVVPDVVAALDAGLGAASGKAGSYVVFWQESVVPGAQGYALMNELERRGYRVGVHPTWRVPATEHRVRLDGEYDAEIHLVSGEWITGWRERGFVEVLEYDGRTPAERERFDELEARVDRRLTEIGREDLIEVVELNIFGASLAPGLPDDVVADLGEMLLLGEELAIFIAPAGSTF